MKKFLLLCWQIVRCVLLGGFVLAGALTLLVGVGLLVNILGCNRYSRYCSYESKDALIAAELEDMRFCVDCTVNGTNVAIIAMRDCLPLASGLAVFVFDEEGKRIDKTSDEGDDGVFQRRWGRAWREAAAKDLDRWLHEARIRSGTVEGLTMSEFAAFMEKSSKAFYSERDMARVSDVLREKRGVRFRCSEPAPVRKVLERQAALGPIEVEGQTFWDVLTNACQQAGCAFEVGVGDVWIRKTNL